MTNSRFGERKRGESRGGLAQRGNRASRRSRAVWGGLEAIVVGGSGAVAVLA
jgi:hypothetical protein